jgi:FkbM family methyltransferase
MGIVGSFMGKGLSVVAGKSRYQRVFTRLHSAALIGRNYGPSDVAKSGELVVLGHMVGARPATSVVFDVGANVGDWTLQAARSWPAATIHAFEPSAVVFGELERVTAGLNVRRVRSALSDHSGEAVLHSVPSQSGLSSLHDRDLSSHGMVMTEHEVVQLTTIDDYCQANAIEHIDVLKVDAEGHDLAVLAGAERMLAAGRVGFVQFEFGGANIDSRTFLRDFLSLLGPTHDLSRLLADGLEPLAYSEREEIFITANFLAIPRSSRFPPQIVPTPR